MLINHLNKYKDFGILLIRLGVGGAFIMIHGWAKISAGPEMWKALGSTMGNFGITAMPEYWGLASALAEFVGGMFLLLGLFTRPVAAIMLFNMAVALTMHFTNLDPWARIAHPLELAFVLLAIIFMGAGRYSLDYLISTRKHIMVKYVKPLKRTNTDSGGTVHPAL